MRSENEVSIFIDAEDISSVKEVLLAIKVTMNAMTHALTMHERKSLPNVDEQKIKDLQQVFQQLDDEPKDLTLQMQLISLKHNLDTINQLLPLKRSIEQLHQDITDTIRLAGAKALEQTTKMKSKRVSSLRSCRQEVSIKL